MLMRWPGWLLVPLCCSTALAGEPVRFESGERQNVMIELFTSEGCNSCPPAEEALNRHVQHPQLWKRVIPLAWHVDYWDYLGWTDRFAQPAHGLRQRQYAQRHAVRTVYTPAFFVNGRSWTTWRHSMDLPEEGAPAGRLRVTVKDGHYVAGFHPAHGDAGPLQLHLAILGMNLTTRIQAGENAGRRALHEFVVLGAMQQESADGRWQGSLPATAVHEKIPRRALAAWVSRVGHPSPMQATGGLLP